MNRKSENLFVYTPDPLSLKIGSPLCFAPKDCPGVFVRMATAGPFLFLKGKPEPYLETSSHPILLPESQIAIQTESEADYYCEIDFFDPESMDEGATFDSGEPSSPSCLQEYTFPCDRPSITPPAASNLSTPNDYDIVDLNTAASNGSAPNLSSWYEINIETE